VSKLPDHTPHIHHFFEITSSTGKNNKNRHRYEIFAEDSFLGFFRCDGWVLEKNRGVLAGCA
jgi:hypothetical protein